eukprot:gene2560-2935_t
MEPVQPIFEIKPATRDDIDTIYSLVLELAEYEKLKHTVIGNAKDIEKWAFGEDKVITIYCGWIDGVIGGYTLHFLNYSTFTLTAPGVYLEDIYVRPQYRGLGYGKLLLLHLCKLAQQRGYGRVEWQVLKTLKPSIDFYESLGAKPLNEWINYRLVGDDITKCAKQFDDYLQDL